MLGKTEGKKRRGRQRMRWLFGITDSMDIEQTQGDGERGEAWGAGVHGVTRELIMT